ncbi:MAG: YjbF family lipoprotein [Pseudomonadota bacterium]
MIALRSKFTAAGLACLMVLSACNNRNEGLIARSFPLVINEVFGGDPPPTKKSTITRARLNQVPFATISIAKADDEERTSFIVAVANNNGYLTYQEPAGRSVVLFGNLLTSTNGLGLDLAAVKHQKDDPAAVKTPVVDWPGVVVRNYQLSLGSRPNYEITVTCTMQILARERIEVVELNFDVTRVQETCRNTRREFSNTYWVADDGQIWKSIQWAGPELGQLVIQTIRPFGG